MQILKHTFIVLQCVGLWRPVNWITGWKTMFYNAYTWFIMFLLITVTLSELIALLGSLDDAEAFANNSFMLLSMIAVCGKSTTILLKRRKIIELTNGLQQDPCRPKSEEELAIQKGFDNIIRLSTLGYSAVVALTVFAIVVSSALQDIPRKALPYKSWLPYECYVSGLGYSIAYMHQIVSIIAGGTVNVAFDTLVPGLMLQTCAQLHILKNRFHEMPQAIINEDSKLHSDPILLAPCVEATLLSRCVGHHISIFDFASTSNDLFAIVLFSQYAMSTIILCVNVFMLSKMKLFSPEFTALFIYTACIVVEIFIYCFFGCQVTFEVTAVTLKYVLKKSVTKNLCAVLKKYITRNVALQYTAQKSVGGTQLFKKTEFSNCMLETIDRLAVEIMISTASDREYFVHLGTVLSNSKDWGMTRKRSAKSIGNV